MTESLPLTYRVVDDVALLCMMRPPVNALGHELRSALLDGLDQALRDDVRIVVLAGTAGIFSAGADITEFGIGAKGPTLRDVVEAIETFDRPVVAAVDGIALGGGLELALACHQRVATPRASFGLPEIRLGILPGAGGTQRLPRLIGPLAALELIMTGDRLDAADASERGLVDAMLNTAWPSGAIDWARDNGAVYRTSEREGPLAGARSEPTDFNRRAERLLARATNRRAAEAGVTAVRASFELPFAEGDELERLLFLTLVSSEESAAQRHVFWAERSARKVHELDGVKGAQVDTVAVVGAGTMGTGIALVAAAAGTEVILVEQEADALQRGLDRVRSVLDSAVDRGRVNRQEAQSQLGRINGTTDLTTVVEAGLVIEAVFEDMAVKKQLFGELGRLASPAAVLATNTSYLDVDTIAAASGRPQDVVGMHFFSPANIMTLVEVVRAREASTEALATVLEMARRMGKVTAVVGVCHGFVGNRMLARRSEQAERLLLEGALPHEVDDVLTDFGFRMGPFAMTDLAGLDIGWRNRQALGLVAPVSDRLVEAGRLGQKTGNGFYTYQGRVRSVDPAVIDLVAIVAAELGVERRTINAEELLDRLLLPIINEGARILAEGIVARASDIDVVWVHGYNWPAVRGGPMYYADQLGLVEVCRRLEQLAERCEDESLRPSEFMRGLAESGRGFAEYDASRGVHAPR